MRFAALTMIILGCAACAGTSDGGGAEAASKKKKDAGVVGCGSSPDMGASPSDLALPVGHDLSSGPPDLGHGVGGACGSTFCRGDQICSAGRCTYACDGYQVPGDFATVLSAMQSLANGPGGTICLGPGTYDETIDTDNGGGYTNHAPITIIGAGADVTTLRAYSPNAYATVTLKGLALEVQPIVDVMTNTTVRFEGVRFQSGMYVAVAAATPPRVEVAYSQFTSSSLEVETNASILVDGCDFTSDGTYRVGNVMLDAETGNGDVTIQNSFFYNSPLAGVAFNSINKGQPAVTVVNDTFIQMLTPIQNHTPASFAGTLSSANNVIYKNNTAVDASGLGQFVDRYNALYGNTTNYAGGALPGPGFVKSDPKLDQSVSPPRPGAGSPLVGAADKNYLPATDYWGRPRTSTDIGAVQH